MTKGIMIAAPSSGAGKTTITLALLRALKDAGLTYASAKSGPDYIDPRFHEMASGTSCTNLDAWAMSPTRIQSLASTSENLLIEAAMGLFDGAGISGTGSAAELARILDAPIILCVDAAKQAHSVSALISGFLTHDSRLDIAGIILNRVGSPKHEDMLRHALSPLNLPILGAIPRRVELSLPERHLGLVQAREHPEIDEFITHAARIVAKHVDIEKLHTLAGSLQTTNEISPLPPPAQRIAIAQDDAFAFSYPHMLQDWRTAGAELSFFSPLADEAPGDVDFVYLPGGYPELHTGTLAANQNFKSGIQKAQQVYGECGGYMVMGKTLIDAKGTAHKMTGVLDLVTSFKAPKLHLGYRELGSLGLFETDFRGHEFHYAATIEANGKPLFKAKNADGNELPNMGLQSGGFAGSFAHIIDRV